jgi:hypothetical protein
LTLGHANPNSWANLSNDDLLAALAETGASLAQEHEALALDQMQYHRAWWEAWGNTDPAKSVAARNRDTERHVFGYGLLVMQRRGTLNSLVAKYDTLRAILDVRTYQMTTELTDISESYPPNRGLELAE